MKLCFWLQNVTTTLTSTGKQQTEHELTGLNCWILNSKSSAGDQIKKMHNIHEKTHISW